MNAYKQLEELTSPDIFKDNSPEGYILEVVQFLYSFDKSLGDISMKYEQIMGADVYTITTPKGEWQSIREYMEDSVTKIDELMHTHNLTEKDWRVLYNELKKAREELDEVFVF